MKSFALSLPPQHLSFGVVRGCWSAAEDALISEQKAKGSNWAQIALYLPGRNRKQVRERWHNKLDPNLKKCNWSVEEDEQLIALQAQHGNCWSKLATLMPGRYVQSAFFMISSS